MSKHQAVYTVGVQVWILPIFRKFKVVDHSVDDDKALGRLLLHHPDGSITAIPGLDRKTMRVYSDYVHAYNTRLAEIAERDALKALSDTEAEYPVERIGRTVEDRVPLQG